ncbi:MAG: transposase [Boseongicola sp.]|nr:transposase [Boseongicola sp.]
MTDVSLAATGVAGADHGETPASPCEADPGPRRRRWPVSGKVLIFAESFAPNGSLRSAARRHGVARSTLSEWRALAREGRLGPVPEVAAPATETPLGRRGRAHGPAH